MRRLLMGFLLPFLVFSSIIGLGFSTWYFADNIVRSVDSNVSIVVSKYASVGSISYISGHEGNRLNISQTHVEFLMPIEIRYNCVPSDSTGEDKDVPIDFTYQIKLSSDLEEYIYIVNDLTPVEGVPNTYEGSWGNDYDMNNPQDFVFSLSFYFSYKPNMQPRTEEEFKNLYNKLIDEKIEIHFMAKIDKGGN